MKRLVASVAAAFTISALIPAGSMPAGAREPGPAYSVPVSKMRAALTCPKDFGTRGRRPVLLVHGTTVTAEENCGWNYAKTLPTVGFDVCTVQLPDLALGDVQISSDGTRPLRRRCGPELLGSTRAERRRSLVAILLHASQAGHARPVLLAAPPFSLAGVRGPEPLGVEREALSDLVRVETEVP